MGGILGITIVLVVVLMIFGVRADQWRRTTEEAYSRLAAHYGGSYHPGGFFNRPTVQFSQENLGVVVDVYSTGGKSPTYYTQVHLYGYHPAVRCEVYPEGLWTRVGKLLYIDDIEIGSPEFDDRYAIRGDNVPAVRTLIGRGVQRRIEELRRFLGVDDIYVSFDRSEILVKKRSFIRDYNTLVQYIELALGLYHELVPKADQTGIEFVKGAPPPEPAETICQVCGDGIETDAVFCRRCRTPHHGDCWSYYGACSTYGCMEKRYLRPESWRARQAQQSMGR